MSARPSLRLPIVCAAVAILAYGCGSGARDVSGINPVPEDPIPGNSHVDAGQPGTDAGQDAGQDSGTTGIDAGFDAGFDAGMNVDAGMPITCTADLPNSCANAGMQTATVGAGQSVDMGGVVDAAGDDYFTINFLNAAGATTQYHPKIEFTSNPNNLYTFEVLTACGSGAAGCSPGLVTFEASFPGATNGCDPVSACSDNATRVTSYIVHVSRTGVPTNCFQYLLHVSNVP